MFTGLLSLFLTGCSLPEPPPRDPPVAPWVGEGWAITVVAESTVRAAPHSLGVDAPDGWRWFDAQLHDAPATGRPLGYRELLAKRWASQSCETMQWDTFGEVGERTTGSGGICTVHGRRHWAIVAVQTHGERELLLAYVADMAHEPYSEAWAEYARTAMTLSGGTAPLPGLEPELTRARVREAAKVSTGLAPIPGGGTLAPAVHLALADLYAQLGAAALPESFAADPN